MEAEEIEQQRNFDIETYIWKHTLVRKSPHELILLRGDRQVSVVMHRDEMYAIIGMYVKQCSTSYKAASLSWFDIARAEQRFNTKTQTEKGKTWVTSDYSNLAFQIVFVSRMLVPRLIDIFTMCTRAHMVGILYEEKAKVLTVFGGGPLIEAVAFSVFAKLTYSVNPDIWNSDPVNWDRVIPFQYFKGTKVTKESCAMTSFVLEHNVNLDIKCFIKNDVPLFSLEREYYPRDEEHYNLLDPVLQQDKRGVVYTHFEYNPERWHILDVTFVLGKRVAKVPDLKVNWYLDSRLHFIDESFHGPYLDVGCGDMALTHKVARKAGIVEYSGCDIHPVDNARWTSSVPEAKVNFVSFYMSLHHLDDLTMNMALSRLNVGGKLVIRDHDWNQLDQSHLHVVHAVGAIKRGEDTRLWTERYKTRYFSSEMLLKALLPYYRLLVTSNDGGPQRIVSYVFQKHTDHDVIYIPRQPPDDYYVTTTEHSLRYIKDQLGHTMTNFDTTLKHLCGVIAANVSIWHVENKI